MVRKPPPDILPFKGSAAHHPPKGRKKADNENDTEPEHGNY